jgi:tetratricopeptide (TPR) repeat protein
VLEPGDFQTGRALGGLAKTLDLAGKLDEALDYGQQALAHRQTYEGPDAWWSNRERLDLAHVLQKLGQSVEALTLLDQLQMSMAGLDDPDEDDHDLIKAAAELRAEISGGGD